MKHTFTVICILTSLFMNAQTKIIAHRGFFQSAPPTTENSIQSLKNAQDLEIYGSEFDVRMTKDGKLVINHDEHHAEMVIAETDFSKLKKVRLSNGEKLPTLKKYLKQGSEDEKLKLIVELKPAKTPQLEEELVKKTVEMVRKLRLENQSEFISFSLNICKEIKRLEPTFIVQYLNGDLSPQQIKEAKLDGFDYHYKILLEKHPTWIQEAKDLGLITNSWTVNDPEIYQKLKKMGIAYVTTNIPEQLKNQ